ncbi:NADPH-dependent FMN reductase [Kitasatospora sp. NPDC089913]|uniref:NADPH-dependent FMN reductase n=1 Tax=Streptomycetaceae TaxID=2062 RepID=UPI00087D42CC|nr:NADPH-dependent FMN reductase [Streptomyces sp. TLI_053]SDT75271.1 FMN reductase [Streptomyces sp. TLI_053]
MATVLSVSGSPSPTSRTTRLLRLIDERLEERGHRVVPFEVRSLPAQALLTADLSHPQLAAALELFAEADGVVIGTPVYKAAYSGLLKALLDVLPQYALRDKAVLPLATGGSTAHVLAVDYALRPVLSSMGADHITRGWFVLDRHITAREDGTTVLERETDVLLRPVVDAFAGTLERLAAPALTA